MTAQRKALTLLSQVRNVPTYHIGLEICYLHEFLIPFRHMVRLAFRPSLLPSTYLLRYHQLATYRASQRNINSLKGIAE
jgi:hypothetical protein